MKEPSLGLIEIKSIARWLFVTDVITKKAPVRLIKSQSVCAGKYLILFCGEVADVEEALKEGIIASGDSLIGEFILPYAHRSLIPGLFGNSDVKRIKSIGVIETFSISAALYAADTSLKASEVELLEIVLASGLGGKGYFIINGELADIEASMLAAKNYLLKEGLLAGYEIIAKPHPEMIEKGIYL